MADTGQERTEQPTGKRLSKARQEGQVAKSQDLNTALILMIGLLAFSLFGRAMAESIIWIFKAIIIKLPYTELTPETVTDFCRRGGFYLIRLLGPFILMVVIIGILANIVQSGWLFTTKPLEFKPDRIMPQNGLKRMVSPRSWAELVKGILKCVIIAWIGYLTLKGAFPKLVVLVDQDVSQILAFIIKIILKLTFRVALAILILGLIDFQFQKWAHLKSLRMSKQEVKDEHKQVEGDPQVKSRIRRIQYSSALNRMIKKLPEADVVVTNPVHVAVALKYDAPNMRAPRVIAKGRRKIAERIKAIAAEHDIPIVEDPPLARALYKACEIGMEIPYELFQAVAEVLAMVYRMKERVAR
jgi:flagellar biosynthetic protein FlhB